jgi:hypothetical protein
VSVGASRAVAPSLHIALDAWRDHLTPQQNIDWSHLLVWQWASIPLDTLGETVATRRARLAP